MQNQISTHTTDHAAQEGKPSDFIEDDGTARFFSCVACGAKIGNPCRSSNGPVKYFHRMRKQTNHLYRWAVAHKNEKQIAASLKYRKGF